MTSKEPEEDAPTISMTATFDAQSQSVIGETDGPKSDLTNRIFQSLAGAFDNVPKNLLSAVNERLSQGDEAGAVEAFFTSPDRGLLSFAPPSRDLVDTLCSIDLSAVPSAKRTEFAIQRTALAHDAGDHKRAAENAEWLLACGEGLPKGLAGSLRLTLGIQAARVGRREAALVVWREVADDPNSDSGTRAWACFNICLLLEPEDAMCEHFALRAAGLFIGLGDQGQWAACMHRIAQSRATRRPLSVGGLLSDALAVLAGDAVRTRYVRGGLLLSKARFAERTQRNEAALADAEEAAACFRGILGAENHLFYALGLAIAYGSTVGRDVSQFMSEHSALAPTILGDEQELRKRIQGLLGNFDGQEASALWDALQPKSHQHLRDVLRVIRATYDDGLSEVERLSLLEDAAGRENTDARGAPLIAMPALAFALLSQGRESRALEAFQKILVRDPLHHAARQNTAALLMKLERYSEAVSFFEAQLRTWGPLPAVRLMLGKAKLAKGEASSAATIFASLVASVSVPSDVQEAAIKASRQALSAGGQVTVTRSDPPFAITCEDWEAALEAFSEHMKRDARMSLWQNSGKEKKWVKCPEKQATQSLKTFLSGKFGAAIEVFEEVSVGAGRIDLYIIMSGGLRFILELKMLGSGYSSNYAFSGDEQLIHYMANKRCHLGYLVIFDARTRDFDKRPSSPSPQDGNKIRIHMVDARPTVRVSG